MAEGIELIGEYEDSGYKEAPYIARRADGQVVQLAPLLYFIAEASDGQRGYDEIAEQVSERSGRGVSGENVQFLVDEKLRPLGVLAQADGSSPQPAQQDPFLALKFRASVIPERAVNAITTVFLPLFFPPVILAALAGLVALDYWLFFRHGVAQPARELIYHPALLLMVVGLVVLATALHEFGHATAARYGGARPGVMGVGIYVVWPAFYTDVTDAYRLGRWGRVRTDLGGVYFNVLFALGVAGVYALTGFEPILILVIVQHFAILQQMLPFLRLDGYYVLSDLTGVPDLFMRVKPTLKSAVPGQETEDSVKQLKPWVRAAVTSWVLFLIPALLFVFGMMVFNAPRMFETAYDSFLVQWDKAGSAFDDGNALRGAAGILQMGLLALPTAGMTASFGRVALKTARGLWSWSSDNLLKQAIVGVVLVGALGVAGYVLLPNGEYRPIQPGERGTIQLSQFEEVGSGRPGLTEERERELGGAPSEREQPRITDDERDPNGTPERSETTTTGGGTRTSTTDTGSTGTAPAATGQTTQTVTTPTTATTTKTTQGTTETATVQTVTTETVTTETTTTTAP